MKLDALTASMEMVTKALDQVGNETITVSLNDLQAMWGLVFHIEDIYVRLAQGQDITFEELTSLKAKIDLVKTII